MQAKPVLRCIQLLKNPNGDRALKKTLCILNIFTKHFLKHLKAKLHSAASQKTFSVQRQYQEGLCRRVSKPSKARNSDRSSLFHTFG